MKLKLWKCACYLDIFGTCSFLLRSWGQFAILMETFGGGNENLGSSLPKYWFCFQGLSDAEMSYYRRWSYHSKLLTNSHHHPTLYHISTLAHPSKWMLEAMIDGQKHREGGEFWMKWRWDQPRHKQMLKLDGCFFPLSVIRKWDI